MKKQYKKWKAGKVAFIVSFLFLCMQITFGQTAVTEFNINDAAVVIDAPGDYLIIGNGEETTNTIMVNVTASSEAEPVNITIRNLNIVLRTTVCPFSITGYVNLTVEGINYISPGAYVLAPACIKVETGNTLVITEASTGSLTLDPKGNVSAAIGGNYKQDNDRQGESAGTIIINGGTIMATGCTGGAGIGGGQGGSGGVITINGGTVTATGGYRGGGSGIGGGKDGDGGTITINGGTVTAMGDGSAPGIGGGTSGSNAGTFSTGENGHAFIITKSISDESDKNNWGGVIIINGSGKVYGNPTLNTDAVIPDSKTLVIADGKTLTLAEGVTLSVLNGGTLTNNGTVAGTILNIDGNGTINGSGSTTSTTGYEVTYNSNYGTNRSIIDYIESGAIPNNAAIIRSYYTFIEWWDNSTGGNKVETISSTSTLYAQWTPNLFTLTIPENYVITHGEDINYDLSQLLPADMEAKTGGATNYAFKNNSAPAGWSISGSTVSCTQPDATDNNGKEVTFTVTAKNTTTADVAVKFVVKPEYDITVTQTTGGTISANKAKTTEGETVTLSYTAEENYDFTGWTVTRSDGNGTVAVSGNTFAMPASDVTVSATFTYNPPAPPTPPVVEPDPDPSPTVFYTVTLPSVEGVTTDPVAGDYEVESWDSYRFYLTLAEGYNLSQPVVTTSWGEQIEPRSSDGAYIIKYVRSNVEIRIDGIVKNPDPVANATIESGNRIWVNEHRLFIRTDNPRNVRIYTFEGNLHKAFRSDGGEQEVSLASGAYIIRIGGDSFKVVL